MPNLAFFCGDSGSSIIIMGSLRLEWERTPSIQSCFPERHSEPNSGASTNEGLTDIINSGSGTSARCIPHQFVSIEVPCRENMHPNNMNQNELEFSPDAVGDIMVPMSPFIRDVGNRPVKNLSFYVPLYKAALKGDWELGKEFICKHPESKTARITKSWERALHIAAGAKHVKFVQELIKVLDPKDLSEPNKFGNTALCFAAASGIPKIAELMVEKNSFLPMVRGSKGVTPLYMAALLGYRDMTWYLFNVTDDKCLTKEDYVSLLIVAIKSDLYDVAVHIIQKKPELAIERDPNGETALHVLARKPDVFSCRKKLGMWQRSIYPWVRVHPILDKPGNISNISMHQMKGILEVAEKKLMQMKAFELLEFVWKQILLLDDSEIGKLIRSPSRPLFIAAEFGNYEFIVELLQSYPDLIWKVDEESQSFFHIAVIHRQEKIFKLIYQIGALKDLITSYKSPTNSNMLHLAAKLAPPNRLNIVSGAALLTKK